MKYDFVGVYLRVTHKMNKARRTWLKGWECKAL